MHAYSRTYINTYIHLMLFGTRFEPPHRFRDGGGGGYMDFSYVKKEMFYLTTHSTHFILRLYSVGHMIKDHSDSERGNPLPPHRLLFPINSNGSFICTIPQTGYISLLSLTSFSVNISLQLGLDQAQNPFRGDLWLCFNSTLGEAKRPDFRFLFVSCRVLGWGFRSIYPLFLTKHKQQAQKNVITVITVFSDFLIG